MQFGLAYHVFSGLDSSINLTVLLVLRADTWPGFSMWRVMGTATLAPLGLIFGSLALWWWLMVLLLRTRFYASDAYS